MKLQLTVNGKILSSFPVNETMAGNDAYLKAIRRLLLLRHQKELQQHDQPNFILERQTVRSTVYCA
ncbi:MAG: hypothetical protein M3Q06_14195 [Bacteroidota bacterium]|nr:hypothetical protein [Bacteroidota bacterium]